MGRDRARRDRARPDGVRPRCMSTPRFSSMQISFPTMFPVRVTSMPELSEISQISCVCAVFISRLQSAQAAIWRRCYLPQRLTPPGILAAAAA